MTALLFLLGALFVWNGTSTDWKSGASGTTGRAASPARSELRVMAFNLAKAGFHRGGLDFAPVSEVRARLDRVAELLRAERIDLAFLSEVVYEAGPAPLDQVSYLAQAGGFHAWTYGDNYSFGLPGFRIRSGNAIISRRPLRKPRVTQLPGNASFWNPTNRRRLLLCEVDLGPRWLLLGSVRNDSFDLANNARQVEAILAGLPSGPVLLGGDFNAEPRDRSFELWRDCGRFRGLFEGAATYPAHAPRRRIDTVLVPKGFEIVSHSVLDVDLSDHEPVLVVLRATDVDR